MGLGNVIQRESLLDLHPQLLRLDKLDKAEETDAVGLDQNVRRPHTPHGGSGFNAFSNAAGYANQQTAFLDCRQPAQVAFFTNQAEKDIYVGCCGGLVVIVDRLVDAEFAEETCLPALAVPMTYAPRALAICTARCPTPPAAASMNTRCSL